MAPAGKNNAALKKRIAAAAAVGLGPNANWAQINEAQRAAQQRQQIAAQQAAYQAQIAARQKQVEDYNRQLAERMAQIQERQSAASAGGSPAAAAMPEPPEAQSFGGSQANVQGSRARRRSNRGSLLAGDTGGYNPATGSSGRLGARSLLG